MIVGDETAEGWEITRLAVIASKVGSGATPRGGSESYHASGIPLVRSQNVHFDGFRDEGLVFLNGKQAAQLSEATVLENDVLLNITGASIGRVTLAPSRIAGARVNQHVCIIRLSAEVMPQFIAGYLASPAMQTKINAEEYGVTRQALTKGGILDFEVPLPPLAEQRRIVAKVEELLARVSAARKRLAKAATILTRLRQSVLAAACSGQLTADWREKHKCEERPTQRLTAILQERRRRWTNLEEDRYRSIGVNARKKLNERYIEPRELVNSEERPTLPKEWSWVRAEQVCDFITKGTTPPPAAMTPKSGCIPYIKVYNLTHDGTLNFSLNPTFIDRMTHTSGSLRRSKVLPGDVLMNLVGPPLGKVSLVPDTFPEWNTNQAVAIYRPVPGISASFLTLTLLTDSILDGMIRGSKATVGQHNLTLEMARNVCIPLPCLDEQSEIVRRVESLFALADKIEARVQAATTRVEKITQAILAKAFRGELVPTEAELARQEGRDYEPASVLLERIRAQREAAPAASRRPRTRAARPVNRRTRSTDDWESSPPGPPQPRAQHQLPTDNQTEIRALSVRQPWADELIFGDKWCENREWDSTYRGPLYIHAPAQWHSASDRESSGPGLTSVIVGKAELVDIVNIDQVGRAGVRRIARAHGLATDRSAMRHVHGPYCWIFTRPRALAKPLATKGDLKLWRMNATADQLVEVDPAKIDWPPEQPKPKPKPTPQAVASREQRNGRAEVSPTASGEWSTEDVLGEFRAALWGASDLTETDLLRDVARRMGHDRLGKNIHAALKDHLRTAVRRQIVARDGERVECPTSLFRNYDIDFLRARLKSIMTPGREYTRDEVLSTLAHYLGYRHVSDAMRAHMKTVFNSAIRQGELAYRGQTIWRTRS